MYPLLYKPFLDNIIILKHPTRNSANTTDAYIAAVGLSLCYFEKLIAELNSVKKIAFSSSLHVGQCMVFPSEFPSAETFHLIMLIWMLSKNSSCGCMNQPTI